VFFKEACPELLQKHQPRPKAPPKAQRVHDVANGRQGEDCFGRRDNRPFVPEAELLLFNLSCVDRFLAQFVWQHKVTKSGQVSIGESVYYVGKVHAGKQVTVRFAPTYRHFVFTHPQTGKTLKHCPSKGLDVTTITGLKPENVPQMSQPYQLPLPW